MNCRECMAKTRVILCRKKLDKDQRKLLRKFNRFLNLRSQIGILFIFVLSVFIQASGNSRAALSEEYMSKHPNKAHLDTTKTLLPVLTVLLPVLNIGRLVLFVVSLKF